MLSLWVHNGTGKHPGRCRAAQCLMPDLPPLPPSLWGTLVLLMVQVRPLSWALLELLCSKEESGVTEVVTGFLSHLY